MKLDFSLTYNPIEEYNEIGYHTTYSIYKENILSDGFNFSNKKYEWLGEGVYFWDNEENAIWWKKDSDMFNKCIFVCRLKCEKTKYLDLDNKMQMKKFDNFLKEYLISFKRSNGYKPKFKNNDECRKYFCDVYCSNNNVSILSFTFEHDIISSFGFKTGAIKRRQICVKNRNCISILNVKE